MLGSEYDVTVTEDQELVALEIEYKNQKFLSKVDRVLKKYFSFLIP